MLFSCAFSCFPICVYNTFHLSFIVFRDFCSLIHVKGHGLVANLFLNFSSSECLACNVYPIRLACSNINYCNVTYNMYERGSASNNSEEEFHALGIVTEYIRRRIFRQLMWEKR